MMILVYMICFFHRALTHRKTLNLAFCERESIFLGKIFLIFSSNYYLYHIINLNEKIYQILYPLTPHFIKKIKVEKRGQLL